MESIKEIYKIGYGPSSSHTMGPAKAAQIFLERNKDADNFTVDLYGSLALTGKGHLTDVTLLKILGPFKTKVNFNLDVEYRYHPNGMKFKAYKNGDEIDKWIVFSVGGGDLKELDEDRNTFSNEVYPHKTMTEIIDFCTSNNYTLIDYIKKYEDNDLYDHLNNVFNTMENCIKEGLNATDILPGKLKLSRKAKDIYENYTKVNTKESLLFALSLAVSEQNASGAIVVTSPTCGSAGVVPGCLFTEYYFNHYSKEDILNALAIAGLICNIVKTNASISGAEVGCQGEIGVACAASSAALTYLHGGNINYIEYAAEIALEHHLGMTCDPIDGVVQIPCIERNAMASSFANYASDYALLSGCKHYVSLDSVIEVMKETGKDINKKYRETSTGGLALKANKI